MIKVILLAFVMLTMQRSDGSRILALIPFSGRSHYISTKPILEELMNRGHHITVIAAYAENITNPNYKHIKVDKKMIWECDTLSSEGSKKIQSATKMLDFAYHSVLFTSEAAFNSSSLQDFIINDDSHYDLILAQILYQESFYMFAHKYKAPIVGIHANGFSNAVGYLNGNPLILSYMTHEFVHFGNQMSVFQKLENAYTTIYDLIMRNQLMKKHQALAEKHFKHLPRPLPFVGDIGKNISIIFMNTHFSYDEVRPYVPGIVEIGGIHIRKPKSLPVDLQNFLDESPDGAVLFSFGSNVQSTEIPTEKVEMFLRVFKKLKQRVIWKWEDDHLAGKPDNVMIGKWLPQNDILAHPKIRAFITHGGLFGVQEAIYHGIPILGFPFYADQFLNLNKIQNRGLGLKLKFSTLTEEEFSKSLNKILTDPKFYKTSQDFSVRFRDRQNSPMDTMIFWMEYVIRNKGAPFLRSPALDLSFLQYYMLDVLFVIFLILLFSALCLWIALIIGRALFFRVKKLVQSSVKKSTKVE